MTTSVTRRVLAAGAILGLATVGIAAAPKPAEAWWRGGYGWHGGYGWCCGVGIGVYVPPVVVAPPPTYYAPAPAYYYAQPTPTRAWIPAHWQNGYWVPGHWS